MDGRSLTANQIEFTNLIVDHVTDHGVVEPSRCTNRHLPI